MINKKLLLILTALAFLAPLPSSANDKPEQGLGLFHRSAAFALGLAAKSTSKAVGFDAEKRANADPANAEMIRLRAKAAQGALSKADEKLFKASGFEVNSSDDAPNGTPDIDMGLYGDMVKTSSPGDGKAVYLIPSQDWLEAHGVDINKAVAIRVPNSIASPTGGDAGTLSMKAALLSDLINLRASMLGYGADPVLLKVKILQLMDFSNTTYVALSSNNK